MFASTLEDGYMEIIYPVFSMFALLSLHLFCYGCNLYMWRSTRINYNFIFEFSPSTSLNYKDVFLICTSIMIAVVGTMVIRLISRSSVFAPSHIDTIPGVLFLFFTGLLISPLNIFYRSSRYCFLRVIRNIVCSPFYKIPLLRHMESTACYFLGGSFKTHQYETCHTSKLFKEFAYIVSFLPYFWRAMQVINMALRVVWVESVMHFNMGTTKSQLVDFVLASLEIIRCGHWNFYRLENKNLNNVEKYRAVNTVPLPFRDIDSDY
ncbi:hypothetical protein GIB67_037629 [Kingdonia uniflora]|uniref:EXS domain-containing protein n=1 Tax=Kingdonia uniflora TaxID=39325 RepID=A0A7J7LSG3_9MAGN|nr:hypothetical protein GIB67_037629 [Kingdonia uniflora]